MTDRKKRREAARKLASHELIERLLDAEDELEKERRRHAATRTKARSDGLVGSLLGRAAFDELLDAQWALWREGEVDALSVLLLDLDHFKEVNDTHGHAMGDEVLRAVGDTLARMTRTGDVAAHVRSASADAASSEDRRQAGRTGGEELAVVLPGASAEEALRKARSILDAVRALQFTGKDGESFGVTASIGVAAACTDDTSSSDLLERADAAMYVAKRNGRNRVVLASPDQTQKPQKKAAGV